MLGWGRKGTGRPMSGGDFFVWKKVKSIRRGSSALCGTSVGSKCVWLLAMRMTVELQSKVGIWGSETSHWRGKLKLCVQYTILSFLTKYGCILSCTSPRFNSHLSTLSVLE